MAIQKYLMSLNLDNGHTKTELLLSNMENKTTKNGNENEDETRTPTVSEVSKCLE